MCAPRLGRLEHAQRDLAARPGDGDGARLLEIDRCGQCATACTLRHPRHSRRQLVDLRHRRDQLLELQVEGAGLGQDLVSGHTGRLRRRDLQLAATANNDAPPDADHDQESDRHQERQQRAGQERSDGHQVSLGRRSRTGTAARCGPLDGSSQRNAATKIAISDGTEPAPTSSRPRAAGRRAPKSSRTDARATRTRCRRASDARPSTTASTQLDEQCRRAVGRRAGRRRAAAARRLPERDATQKSSAVAEEERVLEIVHEGRSAASGRRAPAGARRAASPLKATNAGSGTRAAGMHARTGASVGPTSTARASGRRTSSGSGRESRGHGRPSSSSGGATIISSTCCTMCTQKSGPRTRRSASRPRARAPASPP